MNFIVDLQFIVYFIFIDCSFMLDMQKYKILVCEFLMNRLSTETMERLF